MNAIAIIQGTVVNNAFYFSLSVNGGTADNMLLDTGAFELTFNGDVANALGLPNLGSIQIGVVVGTAQAYQSICNLQIGDQTYTDVPCIVDLNFQGAGLFGLRLFVDNQLALQLDPNSQTLTILSY